MRYADPAVTPPRVSQEISEDRRRSLEALVEDLREFGEGHDALSGWLAQKEKMVTVLGPVAAEPAMVNNQLQQVKVSEVNRRSRSR